MLLARSLAAAMTFIITAAHAASGSIVYNSRNPLPLGIFIINEADENSSFQELPGPFEREWDCRQGDVITLAGTDRFVTQFSTRLWSTEGQGATVTTDVELTLYTRAGNLPGEVIWSGTLSNIVISGTTMREVVFNPHVTVPDTLCFAVSFTNIAATRRFGVVSSQSNLVGTSGLGTIRQDSATLAWREFAGPNDGFRHVDAQITAIPSPAALAVLPLVLLTKRRRVDHAERPSALSTAR